MRHFDLEVQRVIECDVSDFSIRAILSLDVEGRLHPVAFYSSMMKKHEINYEIKGKELLAITSAFKE